MKQESLATGVTNLPLAAYRFRIVAKITVEHLPKVTSAWLITATSSDATPDKTVASHRSGAKPASQALHSISGSCSRPRNQLT